MGLCWPTHACLPGKLAMWQGIAHEVPLRRACTIVTSKRLWAIRPPRHVASSALTGPGGKHSQGGAVPDATHEQAQQQQQGLLPWLLPRQMIAMASAGAVLGPLLDGQHSSNNVLHYHDPVFLRISGWQLETCWWVPLLFGLAGIIIGVGVPVLDGLLAGHLLNSSSPNAPSSSGKAATEAAARDKGWQAPSTENPPSWGAVYACIAFFVAQYGLSGMLDRWLGEVDGHTFLMHLTLAAWAAAHYYAFDRSTSGLVLSIATAVCGPLIEVLLINGPHLYYYERPEVLGIPLWIAWVYFCGGPAVGNLGRKVWATLKQRYVQA